MQIVEYKSECGTLAYESVSHTNYKCDNYEIERANKINNTSTHDLVLILVGLWIYESCYF
jgi:hypothetical protein